ncbi:MAG: ATP-dependent 6-phosphofructokinase [Planctomycetota bacterium]|nr:ATP-dependent 6-phosphofructokinase [Planctomycetota bacterium]MDA1247867.1 ATP-dependent 6-phosphofructokinase [Planctomycetota bacterium]
MPISVGILTSGGDCPGLNAAIRAVGKAGLESMDMRLVGFRDGFRGLMQDRTLHLDRERLSNILTLGGTILGTSRDKPHRMPVGNQVLDMTDAMREVYEKHQLECLVCLGGGGTQKNALRLMEAGMNIITLPKTIDNDVALTDVTFGYDTALSIATEAIDRLHSTATSHNRVIVVEIMGHSAGWLALGAGVAGGADAILIPEIPYDIESVAEAIRKRTQHGKHFSIVAVAEGAMSVEESAKLEAAHEAKRKADGKKEKEQARERLTELEALHRGNTLRVTEQLEQLTGMESRLTILGHLQRGGTPSAADRLLATTLGVRCAELIGEKRFGVMVAARNGSTAAVPLEDVAGNRKSVPLDHPWLMTARRLGVCLGD